MPPGRKICGETFAGSLNATVPLTPIESALLRWAIGWHG